MQLLYQQTPLLDRKFVLVRPYGGEDGSGYGEGDGTVTGERLTGTLRWVNHPHRRGDGTMLPDAHGVIRTNDDALVLFSLTGRTVWTEAGPGRQVLTTLFESQDERYSWLNGVYCVLEGAIEPERLAMRARIYICLNDLV
jgi:hypothetical protein